MRKQVAPGTQLGAGQAGWRQNQSQAGFWPGSQSAPSWGWADSRGPARHRPGAGPPPPPGPIPADRCQGAVCSVPGVNFLLKTIKLLRAEGICTGQQLTISGMVGTGWFPVWFFRCLSSEAKVYRGYGCGPAMKQERQREPRPGEFSSWFCC